ncbi:MAG: hypothetical protein P9L99_16305 [Candidatus Lernaella stagnicola]|nr:hypothetical protein [Candidatus Lernaella stagnicola]
MSRAKTFHAIWLAVALALVCQVALHATSRDEIIFSHERHRRANVACESCHAATLSDTGVFRKRPDHAVCGQCHDVTGRCKQCHTRSDAAKSDTKKERITNFTHEFPAQHKKPCIACHGDALDIKPVSNGGHSRCGECHASDLHKLLCAKCHRRMSRERLYRLQGFTHDNNFPAEHGAMAMRSPRVCMQCHREAYCNDCHAKKPGLKPSVKFPEQVRRKFIHRGDWLTKHHIEGRTERAKCVKCHGQSDCRSCHDRERVSARSGKSHIRHPGGWMSPGSSHFHGEQARRDIVSCATCHHAKGPGYCLDCHQASGGRNPHPPGWNSPGKNTSDRMCKKCHGK